MTLSRNISRSRKIGAALLPSILTGGLLLVVYASFGFAPFGDKSIAWCDMNQQVVPLMAEFRRVLLGEGSFLRSPGAGGINFWGIFFFFLSSPFSLLSVLVKPEQLPWFMNWMLLGKMMVCAFTGAMLFRRLSDSTRSIPATLMGVLYAFSGYTLMYYQNIVWLDMMALFPLLILSIIRLEQKRQVVPFILVFSGMLVVHYYLSYMVVLFLLFSYGLYLVMQCSSVRRGESILLLGAGAIISVLLTAVVWLPSLLEVWTSARGEGLVKGLAQGDFASQLFTTLPSIFTAGIVFAALFFLRRKHLRTGIFSATMGITALMLIPLLIQPINKMWHTGSYQGFPTRYGYMLGLLTLLAAFWIIRGIAPDTLPKHSKKLATAILAILTVGYIVLVLWMLANYLPNFSVYSRALWGDETSFFSLLGMLLAAVVVYVALLGLWQNGYLSRRIFTGFAAVLIFTEAFFNAGAYLGDAAKSQENYTQVMALSGKVNEDGFFRVKASRKYFDVNLLSAMGYESLAHYTSLTPETTLLTQRRLGYSGYWMEVGSDGGTAFTDALLGNEYVIVLRDTLGPEALSDGSAVFVGEKYALVRQPFDLPDAVITDAEPGFLQDLPADSRMDIQSLLARTLFPESGELFTRYQPDATQDVTVSNGEYFLSEGKNGILHWTIPITKPTTLYFDCAAAPTNALSEAVNKSCNIWVNGTFFRKDYPSQAENGILNLGTFTSGTVEVTVELDKEISPESFELFGLDEQALTALCENAAGAELSGSGSRFTLSCTAEEGQTLFVPLSFDKGWKATVNGKEVPISRAAGNYLSLPLEAGEIQVVLSYTPPGLWIGLVLGIVGLLLLGLLLWKKKRFCSMKWLQKTALLLFAAAVIGVLLVVYVVPVVIWIFF